jgi:hypothetical protein
MEKKDYALTLNEYEASVLFKVLAGLRGRTEFHTAGLDLKSDCDTIYFDIDSTLILYKETPSSVSITDQHGITLRVTPHFEHIERLKQHHKDGCEIVLWSAAGSEWPRIVAKALGIQQFVSAFHSKPVYFYDDLEAKEWLGKRVYVKAET